MEQATRLDLAYISQYPKETAGRFAANDLTIIAFKARMANETAEVKASYEKQLAQLEQKNSDMKKKLANYRGEGKEQWETFKVEFSQTMESDGNALDDLTVKF
ncbi:hypothetical protein NC796_24555 [Aliifodinibius sp. S!AR15-10]|uniref:hypothetical protein n=1 Tax=Aliifodinibius sp. S!AR15-10 TaxID=2950437 RepID=UPI002857A29C|nr:hypothetical protein [Aliifodinibius sp. S!AR15-10]MDR8394343.1 hypothetical protein [Aliifodinibius sp. S!AR15-10]